MTDSERKVCEKAESTSALSILARLLHDKMEHLDPSTDDTWEDLTHYERRFYELCIIELASNQELFRQAYLEISLPTTTR